tara:strand:+ start:674 stop:916 length:243 start_codon:yes stop_codon:yes gene_type:complete
MSTKKEWLKFPTAKIRFTKDELQNLILALVIAKDSAETFSLMETSKRFDNIRKDIVKIKNDLIKKEESYEENNFKTRQNI